MLPVIPTVPSEEVIRFLWDKFAPEREMFGEAFSKDLLAFGSWLCAKDVVLFLVYAKPEGEPIGAFIFNQVVPGGGAMAHINVWGREQVTPANLIEAAQMTCGAMFRTFKLERICGLTPVTFPAAKAFAQQAGFHVVGTARRAVLMHGKRVDAWLTDLLPEDLPTKDATMDVKE